MPLWNRKDRGVESLKEAVEVCQEQLEVYRGRIRSQQSRIALLEQQMRQVREFLRSYELAPQGKAAKKGLQVGTEEEPEENGYDPASIPFAPTR